MDENIILNGEHTGNMAIFDINTRYIYASVDQSNDAHSLAFQFQLSTKVKVGCVGTELCWVDARSAINSLHFPLLLAGITNSPTQGVGCHGKSLGFVLALFL